MGASARRHHGVVLLAASSLGCGILRAGLWARVCGRASHVRPELRDFRPHAGGHWGRSPWDQGGKLSHREARDPPGRAVPGLHVADTPG